VNAKLALVSLSLFALTGCSRALVGKWTLDKNSPDLKQAKTIIMNIQFDAEGTYKADVRESAEGLKKSNVKTGKYQFNGFQLKLSAKDQEQVWDAMVIMNRTLKLKRSGDKLTLKRVEE